MSHLSHQQWSIVLGAITLIGAIVWYVVWASLKEKEEKEATERNNRESREAAEETARQHKIDHQLNLVRRFNNCLRTIDSSDSDGKLRFEVKEHGNGSSSIIIGYLDSKGAHFTTFVGVMVAKVELNLFQTSKPPLHVVFGEYGSSKYFGIEEDTVDLVVQHLVDWILGRCKSIQTIKSAQ